MNNLLSNTKKAKVFGHRQLTYIFIPLIKVLKNGFYFKKKFYPWYEVNRIHIWLDGYDYSYDNLMVPPQRRLFTPCAQIILKSGKILFINGDNLEKKQGKLDKGFLTAFDELVYDLNKHKEIQLPTFPLKF